MILDDDDRPDDEIVDAELTDDEVDDAGEWLDGLRERGFPVRTEVRVAPAGREMSDEVWRLLRAAKAPATQAAYEAALRDWWAWCTAHRYPTLPSEPSPIVEWIASMVRDRLAPATIRKRLAALTYAYRVAGLPKLTSHPDVVDAVAGAARTLGGAQLRARVLTLDQLQRLLTGLAIARHADITDPRVSRDRCLLALGWASALRAGELVALNTDDLTFDERGLLIHLRRSKTDQEALGRYIAVPYAHTIAACPVIITQRHARAVGPGPLFCSIDRHRTIGRRLSGHAVSTIVRDAVRAVLGIDPDGYSGHSLRRGHVTEARAHNVPDHRIIAQTGHATTAMLEIYNAPADAFAATSLVGEWW